MEPPEGGDTMKQVRGTLLECVKQAADICHLRTQEEQGTIEFYCRIRYPLLTGLYLNPGESEQMTLKRLGEAIIQQARVSSVPVGHQSALLEYGDAWVGEALDDRRIFGKVYLVGASEPVALIYQLDLKHDEVPADAQGSRIPREANAGGNALDRLTWGRS
jgi:hypothetical protein